MCLIVMLRMFLRFFFRNDYGAGSNFFRNYYVDEDEEEDGRRR